MFAFLYTLVIHLSVAVARMVALFHPKTRKWVEGQKNILQLLKKNDSSFVIPNSSFTIWFHAASLGEFEQGRPVIEAVRLQYPEAYIVLTFFSPSGYEIRKNYESVNLVCYLPADTPPNVKRFLDVIQPDIALFIKYEFWHNYLQELKKRQIPTLLFSAIFRPKQLFFKSYGGFYRNMLFCFNRILVQNRSSEDLLHSAGYSAVEVTGDTRLDRVVQIAAQAKTYPAIEGFKGDDLLLIAGSVWPDDMEVLIPFLNHRTQPLKVIIAPHEINVEQIEKWQSQLQKSSVRLTIYRLESEDRKEEKNNSFDILHSAFDILFLDTVGMLSSVYRYAEFAYIGGGFGDGLHNILEPAVFGMPIFFGQPHYKKFQEAHDLLHLGGAVTVADSAELENAFKNVYLNTEVRERKARICSRYISQNAGATDKVMQVINEVLLLRQSQ